MKYIITVIILCIVASMNGCEDRVPNDHRVRNDHDVIYHIVNVHDHANFNYQLINEYKSSQSKWGDRENVIEIFRPVNGQYRVIQFMAAFWGRGKDEKKKIFHEILIVKVDHNNIILDSLQYTLEWGELPQIYDIYYLKSKDAKLTKNLDLSKLQFGSLIDEFESYLAGDRPPTGILDNIYNFKEQF